MDVDVNVMYFFDGHWWIEGSGSLSCGFHDHPTEGSVYVDRLRGGNESDDMLIGGATEDYLEARGGEDWLEGGLGADTLDAGGDDDYDYLKGGQGDDDYWQVTSADEIFEALNKGHDKVSVSVGNFALPANVEDLTFAFGTGGHTGWGNSLANYIGGGDGADLLYGGGGADSIIGNQGKDTLYGDGGNDRLEGRLDTDRLFGGAGHDILEGGDNADTLNGGTGDDTLIGGQFGNKLIGGDGDDLYWIAATDDVVQEAADGGYDEARFTVAGSFVLAPNVEAGTVISNGASITGNGGDNYIVGDSLANRLDGVAANDMLSGWEGKDTLSGGTGDDTLTGGSGADRLVGADGLDTASYGGPGGAGGVSANLGSGQATDTFGHTDTLVAIENLQGSAGNDLLVGDGLANVLSGSDGADTLAGGTGTDQLNGNLGADRFRFNEAGTVNADTIFGFDAGSDRIQLDNGFFDKLVAAPGGALKTANFRAGTAAVDGDDYVIYDSGTGKLYYDADANGAGAKKLIATISGGGDRSASDFEVI